MVGVGVAPDVTEGVGVTVGVGVSVGVTVLVGVTVGVGVGVGVQSTIGLTFKDPFITSNKNIPPQGLFRRILFTLKSPTTDKDAKYVEDPETELLKQESTRSR